MSNDITLVVSKYTENIDWVNQVIHPVVIYDKSDNPVPGSIKRPNIGREAETLLYYIITNYFSLPDLTIFLQGDPRGNPVNLSYEQVVDEINKTHINILQPIATWEGRCYFKDYWLKTCELLNNLIFDDTTIAKYASGCQYIIPKDNILCRPLSFYITLHMLVSRYGNKKLVAGKSNLDDGVDAWTLEVVWGNIFNSAIELKEDWEINLFNLL